MSRRVLVSPMPLTFPRTVNVERDDKDDSPGIGNRPRRRHGHGSRMRLRAHLDAVGMSVVADAVKKVGGIRDCVERRSAETTMGGPISMNSCSAHGPTFISIYRT